MLRKLYHATLNLAKHRHATTVLVLVAFAESFVFPIPPDLLLLPMLVATPQRAFRLAAITTLASTAGGLVGYLIGFFLFETVGRAILDLYSLNEGFDDFAQLYRQWGAWITFTAGFTILPYKIFTIAAGVVSMDIATFALASLISRGARFYLLATLAHFGGPTLKTFLARNINLLFAGFLLLLIAGFALLAL